MEKGMLGNKLKSIGLILYFVILTAERLLALILSVNSGGEYALTTGRFFNYLTYSVTLVSLSVGVVLTAKIFPNLIKYLFSSKQYPFEDNYRAIVIASMALLYGGMMHTGFTLAPLQFVAYGFLIATMVVRCVEECKKEGAKKFSSIVSVIYLTLFSMTVPVCYIALKLGALTIPFYIVEFAAAFVLIPVFGLMLLEFYKKGVTNFSFVNPLIMLVLSGLTVALKWSEEINWFVLIFVVLTLVFYLAFGIVAGKKAK